MLCVSLAAAVLCGCGQAVNPTVDASPTAAPYCTITPLMSPTAAPTFTPSPSPFVSPVPTAEATAVAVLEPYDFALDYHRAAALLVSAVGECAVSDARAVIDAFLCGKTSVVLNPDAPADKYLLELDWALQSMCPPFIAFTSYRINQSYNEASASLSWEYTVDADTLADKLEAFSAAIDDYMSVLRNGDGDIMRAMLLYHSFTVDAVYDSYIGELPQYIDTPENNLRISGYSALINHSGICLSYAYGLSFLFAQADIDCVPVKSTGAPAGDHAWTLVRFGGIYSYCDATWDMGGSFRYFGSSASERARPEYGGFPLSSVHLIYDVVTDVYAVKETRFVRLHEYYENAEDLIVDRNAHTVTVVYDSYYVIIDCSEAD